MAIEGDIQAVLATLVSGRCYPTGEVPDSPTSPYIVFQVISNTSDTLTETLGKRRVQVDVYGKGYNVAKALEAQVLTAMDGAAFTSTAVMARDSYDKEVKLNRQIIEFKIWGQ